MHTEHLPRGQGGRFTAGRLSSSRQDGSMAFPIRERRPGGGRGIRTLEGVAPLHAFQACPFGRSGRPPRTSLATARSGALAADEPGVVPRPRRGQVVQVGGEPSRVVHAVAEPIDDRACCCDAGRTTSAARCWPHATAAEPSASPGTRGGASRRSAWRDRNPFARGSRCCPGGRSRSSAACRGSSGGASTPAGPRTGGSRRCPPGTRGPGVRWWRRASPSRRARCDPVG